MEGISTELKKPVLAAPPLSDDQIAETARNLRVRYYDATGEDATSRILPENVVWELLDAEERVSLDIESRLGTTKDGAQIAGQMVVCDEGGKIKVDSDMVSKPLYPFTLSHEIGHWMLHRVWVIQWLLALRAIGDTETVFLTLNRDLGHKSPTQVDPVEWQANRFAVHFLMPSADVNKEFRWRFGRYSRRYADLFLSEGFRQQHPTRLDYARFMAQGAESRSEKSMVLAFGTSLECMAIRLQELELV